jgi:putative NIF3 family GTP cyclohydrolase 1 type 2
MWGLKEKACAPRRPERPVEEPRAQARKKGGRMQLTELGNHLDTLLDASRLKDYCPNGLQVEGRPEVMRVLCGVTASQALLDLAASGAYDAVFVHHGLFWKGDDGRVTGFRRRRLRTLLANDISLFAYHLPLDVHPELGNNAQLARLMGWQGRRASPTRSWAGSAGRRAEGERADEIARALPTAARARAAAGR